MKKYRKLLDCVMVPDGHFNTELDFCWVSADDLFTVDRIDLVVKLLYLKSIDTNCGVAYSEYLYKEHLACFSHGCFYEPGNKEKNSFEKFKLSFNDTFMSIKNDSFNCNKSLIPVAKNTLNLIDGAHRVSCAIYLGKEIPIIEVDMSIKGFNLDYFKKEGMKDFDLDFLCHRYIDYSRNKNFNAICVWPRAEEFFDQIDVEIKNTFRVLTKKVVNFDINGSHNFLSQIYSHDEWVGSYENDFQGVSLKRSECFGNNKSPTIVYFVESDHELDYITNFKNELRRKFGFGKHLLHITDNKEECLQICELTLNNNSLLNLKNSYPTRSKKFQKEFYLFLNEINEKQISKEDICVVGGSVLAVFGIRDTDDIDFITSNSKSDLSGRFDLKNYEFDDLDITYDDVIYNPNNYFYYMGIKFCNLLVVSKLKENRREAKDLDDVKAIKLFLSSEKTIKSAVSMKVFLFKRYLRRKLVTLRVLIGKILRKLGLFSYVKKMIGSF